MLEESNQFSEINYQNIFGSFGTSVFDLYQVRFNQEQRRVAADFLDSISCQ